MNNLEFRNTLLYRKGTGDRVTDEQVLGVTEGKGMTGYEEDRVTDEQVLRVTGGQGMTGYEEDRVTDGRT